jgi:hypothetical protein
MEDARAGTAKGFACSLVSKMLISSGTVRNAGRTAAGVKYQVRKTMKEREKGV